MKQIQFLFDISPKVKHQKTSLRAFELIKEKGDGFWRLGIQLKAQICYVVDSGDLLVAFRDEIIEMGRFFLGVIQKN